MIPTRVSARMFERSHWEGGCRVSDHSTMSAGYCQIGWSDPVGVKRKALVHRVAWEVQVGPIHDELTVDHLCRNRRCFNLWHLRLVTRSVNSTDNGRPARTHCPQGHPYDAANTYRWHSQRLCRICQRGHNRARRLREVRT